MESNVYGQKHEERNHSSKTANHGENYIKPRKQVFAGLNLKFLDVLANFDGFDELYTQYSTLLNYSTLQ